MFERYYSILDSVGIGNYQTRHYGDKGSNTLKNTADAVEGLNFTI